MPTTTKKDIAPGDRVDQLQTAVHLHQEEIEEATAEIERLTERLERRLREAYRSLQKIRYLSAEARAVGALCGVEVPDLPEPDVDFQEAVNRIQGIGPSFQRAQVSLKAHASEGVRAAKAVERLALGPEATGTPGFRLAKSARQARDGLTDATVAAIRERMEARIREVQEEG